jgi:hypothetical protein
MKKTSSMSFRPPTLHKKWGGRKEEYDSNRDGKNYA